MKKSILISVFLLGAISSFAQKDEVLLTIDKKPVYASEFKRIYEKNLDQISEDEKNVEKNLDLFINYKLKLLEAYKLKLDTSKNYKSELNTYKNQLIVPYLQDEEFKQKLVKEAYDRTVEEVRASHILIGTPQKLVKVDTTQLIQRLDSIKKKIENGESFERLAQKYSEDPSAKINGGDLGYFSAFRMVYPFEEAAYNTPVGKVSKPFKTRFGYHILKVTDKRKSRGAFKVAHILAKDRSIAGKVKIDSLYKKIQKGTPFSEVAKKYSEDKPSAINGGVLPKFTTGRMVPPFEKAVLALKKKGDVSKPFKTRFGWHIVQLIENDPVKPFSELKGELEGRVRGSNRGSLSMQKLIKDLKKKYKPLTNNVVLELIQQKEDIDKEFSETQENETIITIGKKKILFKDFLNFAKGKNYIPVNDLWERFKNQEVLNYYKEDLGNIYPEYKYTLQEYKDGLLLFDLMKLKIWDSSQKDTDALTTFFEKNKSKYGSEDLSKVRGEVINDYQKYLEESWVASLRKEHKITVKKKTLKKIKKTYNQ